MTLPVQHITTSIGAKDGHISGFHFFDFPEKSPVDLKPEIMSHNKRYGIKPLLLNPGDSITVEILNVDVYEDKAKVDLHTRIVGVKKKSKN